MLSRVFGRAMVLSLLALSIPSSISANGEKILVFKDSLPYSGHAAGIAAAMTLMKGFASSNAFTIDTTIHLTSFNKANLAQYAAVVLMYPEAYNKANPSTGLSDTMSADQDSAFKDWVLSGKGVVGVHAHTRMNSNWPWYVRTFMGLRYVNDIGPQSSTYHVSDPNEFLTMGLPKDFTDNQQVRVDSLFFTEADTSYKVLIRADAKDYPAGQTQSFYPFVYRHNYQGGRYFGLAPGHNADTWNSGSNWNKLFLNGILYALNRPGYGPTGIADGPAPMGFELQRFSDGRNQSLRFGLPKRAHVAIRLYDFKGRMLSRLIDATLDAGSHSVPLPEGLRGSLYFVDFKTADFHRTMKIVR
ncbi:MAG: ThuA domain-containing protein [Fibrobacteres bacterium]|jgi:type 1 glutamine amidotransferase|nr:ThuA domain-containing protein [Fibrobacterota bacterium]